MLGDTVGCKQCCRVTETISMMGLRRWVGRMRDEWGRPRGFRQRVRLGTPRSSATSCPVHFAFHILITAYGDGTPGALGVVSGTHTRESAVSGSTNQVQLTVTDSDTLHTASRSTKMNTVHAAGRASDDSDCDHDRRRGADPTGPGNEARQRASMSIARAAQVQRFAQHVRLSWRRRAWPDPFSFEVESVVCPSVRTSWPGAQVIIVDSSDPPARGHTCAVSTPAGTPSASATMSAFGSIFTTSTPAPSAELLQEPLILDSRREAPVDSAFTPLVTLS
jgi:hypothetical protein